MLFNFERDHSEMYSMLEDSTIERKYIREFYLRLNTRGIYTNEIRTKTSYKSIEDELNSNFNLRILVFNAILNTNDEYLIKHIIDTAPNDLYNTFLKCSLLNLNDIAVEYIIENWPYETLELYDYFKEAYSSLLLFYNTDINSFTGKIAPEILKWILIGSKYTKLITNLVIKNRLNNKFKLKYLDLTNLPITNSLLNKLINYYYDLVFNLNSIQNFCNNSESDSDSDLSFSSTISNNSESLSTVDLFTDSRSSSSSSSSSSNLFALDTSNSPMSRSNSDCEQDLFENLNLNKNKKKHQFCLFEKSPKKMCLEKDLANKICIKLDAILANKNLLEKYLKISQKLSQTGGGSSNFDNIKFELVINRLDLTFHNQTVCVIDESFDSAALKINGLGIFFNANINEAKYVLSILRKFKNIQELNLSAFGRDNSLSILMDNEEIRKNLQESFKEFKHLKRLRLNMPNMKHRLELVLKNLEQPLEYLNLTSCCLTDTDLNYLSESKHTKSLRNLVLSNNDLANCSGSIIRLLNKCCDNLEILDLGCNSFSYDTYIKIVDEAIFNLKHLKMLITLDVFTFDNYLKIADKMCNLREFISWRINYSADYYEQSVRIKNKFKFRKFKSDYIKTLQNKFDLATSSHNTLVKLTINDPDINYILNEIL